MSYFDFLSFFYKIYSIRVFFSLEIVYHRFSNYKYKLIFSLAAVSTTDGLVVAEVDSSLSLT